MAQLLNHETNASAPTILYERDTKAERRHQHLYPSLAAVAGIALSIAGFNALKSTESIKPDSHDDQIASITIENGARFRDNPTLGNSAEPNFPLYEFSSQDQETITIETPHGVDIKTNNNGEWYGLPSQDIAAAIPDSAGGILKDADGRTWVNHQLSHPSTSDKK